MKEPVRAVPQLSSASPAALLAVFKKQQSDRDAAARAAKADLWTGLKVCPIFKIPASFITPNKAKPSLDPQAVEVSLNLQMGYTQCIGNKCGLWNAEEKECQNATNTRSRQRIADILESMDGLARIQSAAGGQ